MVAAMLLGDLLGASGPSVPAILLLALALDAVLGEMGPVFRPVPHPVVRIGRAIGAVERRWNTGTAGPSARRWRGVGAVVLLCGAAAAGGAAVAILARAGAWLWPVEALAVALLLAQRGLYDHVAAVARGLEQGGVAGGRAAVRHIVGRDPMSLDEHGVSRAAIESLAENFSDGVTAPAFWYLLFGLPGILVYKTVNTLDSMIGHKTARYLHFGWAAARLDDLLNLVPARSSGAMIAVAALFQPGARTGAAVASMLRDARKHRSPNAGWPEASMAGALGFKLAGPRRYPGEVVDAPFIGPGTPDLTAADIRRALRLFVLACVVQAIVVALAAL
ncbi:MAG: cobalamin biosynthesis protein CobD [Alphaproteobacteria bacterium]|nr:cobalamin biosynthesis protein CobD [Alphaproteobacteria bacterium]